MRCLSERMRCYELTSLTFFLLNSEKRMEEEVAVRA